ncbi:acrB Ubiquitination network signaling protein acrB [Candida maltosa Xu316]
MTRNHSSSTASSHSTTNNSNSIATSISTANSTSVPTSHHHHHHYHDSTNKNNINQEFIEKTTATPSTSSDHHHHHHHHYKNNSTNFPSSSSLRDILSLVFIILSFPQHISLIILMIYLMLGSNFMGGKFLINFILPQNYKLLNFYNFKKSLINFIKIGIIDLAIFIGLSKVIKKKSYFNYLIILSKSIVASELIGSNSINYINSISSKKITTKIQYDDKNRIFNSNLINAIICFIIINYVNYVLNWINFSFQIFNNFHRISLINNLNFHHLELQIYLFLSIHTIVQCFFKRSPITQSSIPNISDDITINIDNNKLLDIEVRQKQQKHTLPTSLDLSNHYSTIAFKNFENFIISPFNSKLSVIKNRMRASSLSNLSMKTTTTSTTTSLTSSTTSTSVTLIENTIIVQPFWSIIAAIKAILKNPNLFNGQSTKRKNEGGEFLTSNCDINNIPMSIMVIDSSKIIIKFLTKMCGSGIFVKLNGINWSYFKIVDDFYLVIYGLTPLFQYEVDILSNDLKILNHFVVNTTNGDDQVINKSIKETSSLTTLQTSLESIMMKIDSNKTKLKKFKKDENKKITELKNSIEILKNKISKNKQGNDNRVFGKIKGLKHSVMQLENEINGLQQEITTLNNQELELNKSAKNQEKDQSKQLSQLESSYLDYESRLREIKLELKNANQELNSVITKNQKLLNKQTIKQEELKNLNADLRNIKKNEISAKFIKRIKRTNEKFETILPKIIQETESLTHEYNDL